jgi:hypothetical protein
MQWLLRGAKLGVYFHIHDKACVDLQYARHQQIFQRAMTGSSSLWRGTNSLSDLVLLSCGNADFGPFARSLSSNSSLFSSNEYTKCLETAPPRDERLSPTGCQRPFNYAASLSGADDGSSASTGANQRAASSTLIDLRRAKSAS